VLVLDGDPHGDAATIRARWIRGATGEAPDGIDGTLADGCPRGALRDGEPVTLVIRDAALDIERLASLGFAATPLGALQRRRLVRERRRDRLAGTLVWLGRHASSDARAAVQRETLDPAWIERLEPLVRDGLVIAEAVLPEHLLAAAHGRRAVPRFTVSLETRHVRHVLVIDGVACFSRRVASSDDPHTVARDIVVSLAHALDRWSLTRVSLDANDLSAQGTVALDALLGEVPARIESCGNPFRDSGTIEADQAPVRLAGAASRRIRGSATLAPLTDAWRERVMLQRLARLRAAGLVLVLGIAAHALAVGPAGATRARALDLQRASVLSDLDTTRAATEALHARPEQAARFLMAFERLGESAGTAPGELLVDIARALTRHDGLALDAIAWSHRSFELGGDPDGAVFDEAVYTDAASLPFAHRSDAARLSVELDGRVTGTTGLREAQARVHAFVDEVRTIAALHDCRIVASPLSTAARGEAGFAPAAADPVAVAPVWRVRCASTRDAS